MFLFSCIRTLCQAYIHVKSHSYSFVKRTPTFHSPVDTVGWLSRPGSSICFIWAHLPLSVRHHCSWKQNEWVCWNPFCVEGQHRSVLSRLVVNFLESRTSTVRIQFPSRVNMPTYELPALQSIGKLRVSSSDLVPELYNTVRAQWITIGTRSIRTVPIESTSKWRPLLNLSLWNEVKINIYWLLTDFLLIKMY